MIIFTSLLAFVSCLCCFYGGLVLGIADCKRRYSIPKGADPQKTAVVYDYPYAVDEEI